ncbi:MAG: hypothetical protein AB2A00_43165 [Myxococcota bacterium]
MRHTHLLLLMLAGALAAQVACAPEPSASDAGIPDAGRACERDPIDASLSCVKPCDEGNERFVGEFCTKAGGECDDNSQVSGGALFCTADYDDSGNTFCTRPCEEDSQCGTGASCAGDPSEDGGRKGCVPTQCL